MPLMSAAKLWLGLKSTVADEKLFNDITILLLSQVRDGASQSWKCALFPTKPSPHTHPSVLHLRQAVAVCLEKGDSSSAYSALNWVKEEQQFPEVGSTNMDFCCVTWRSRGGRVFFFRLTVFFFPTGLDLQADHRGEKGRRLPPAPDELQLQSPVGDGAELHWCLFAEQPLWLSDQGTQPQLASHLLEFSSGRFIMRQWFGTQKILKLL